MSINQPINFLLPEDLASQIGERAPRVPQLIRQVTDFIRHDSKTLHYKRESCCAVVGFFTPSA